MSHSDSGALKSSFQQEMKTAKRPACKLAIVFSLCGVVLHAQTVVKVSQVLPFSSSGTVSSVAKGEEAVTTPPSASTTPPAAGDAASLTSEGGKLVTGADGAASLLLGSSGTARMEADSEIKVPDAQDTGHSLELLKGKLFLNIEADEVKKRGNGEFKLKTPAALLAVKGTKFFTISVDGTDTIGVHQGSVAVSDPTTGKEVILESGKAVSVSPGMIGEVREITDEEKGYQTAYASTELIRTPIPVVVKTPIPNTKKLQIVRFQNGVRSVVGEENIDRINYGTLLRDQIGLYFDWRVLKPNSVSNPISPQLTDDGIVRYVWRSAFGKAETPTLCYFDFAGHSRSVYSGDNRRRMYKIPDPVSVEGAIAILFQARFKGIEQASLRPMYAQQGRLKIQMPAQDGVWVEVEMLPRKELNYPYRDLFSFEAMELLAQNPSDGNVMALEVKDFVLLRLPKDQTKPKKP